MSRTALSGNHSIFLAVPRNTYVVPSPILGSDRLHGVTQDVVNRVKWPGADPLPAEPGPTRAVVARTFAYLYGAGGTLALGTLLLPHGPHRDTAGIAAPGVAALVVALVSILVFDRLSLSFFRWLPVLGTVLASCVMVAGDAASTIPYAGFYFWVVLSSFYLFDARWAWMNVALVGAALAIVLELSPRVGDRALAWTMVMGALAVGGAMIGLLRARLEDVAAQSQAALARSVESEHALAEAQRIAQVGSWEADLATGSFQGSAEFFRILGLDDGAVTTVDPVLAALGQAGRGQVAEAVAAARAGDEDIELEHTVDLPRLGRRVLATRARVVRPDGQTITVVGTTQDVTERRAQEERLQRTLRRLRATIDIGLALGRDPDPAALVQLISDRAQSLLGADAVFVQLDDEDAAAPAAAGELRAPLAYGGSTHGVLVAVPPAEGHGFTREDDEMLRAFASSAAIAVAGMKTVQDDALRRSIEAAERERRRFARELHDQTLQGLGALISLLEATPAGDAQALGAAATLATSRIRDEIENVRRIIADLRPTYLDEFGLAPALEALVERVRADGGLDVEAAIEPVPGLEPAAEQTIYRVVQEGLTNVRKHANASRVRVVVSPEGAEVVVRVEDDGTGFEGTRTDGFGLIGMRERLALLGATLNVESGPGGTILDARVPLRAPAGG